MDEKYKSWIDERYPTPTAAYGQCATASKDMCEAFPELVRVRGHYFCPIWGPREHWWCTTVDGVVVDPTAAQFPSQGRGQYGLWDETQEEPTGVCPNCRGYVYGGTTCCSERCHDEYVAYCSNPNA